MRKQLRNFAKAQEEILKDNDSKLYWSFSSRCYLQGRIAKELKELKKAKTTLDMQKECIDIANFAMMLFDNLEKEAIKSGGNGFLKSRGYEG